ncbi:MAG: nitroreductase family deazaflavin-dependent oxidoreductase [Chloroflexi bacterium]|nr:nitroreductase family deazaflavin-dependent oxidoreductase [Chloroflexota bacterium]
MEDQLRKVFWYLNKFFMVPMFRLGFGAWMGTPFGGYIMVLKVVGRKSGMVRYAPVNYAIENGDVFCIAGFGKVSDWYRNILAHPDIEVLMPGGTIRGVATQVDDDSQRLRVIRQVLINGGFAGFAYGYDPRTATDEQIQTSTANVPVIRIRSSGVGSGAFDPGGWAWIPALVGAFAFFAWLVRRKKS